MVIGTRSIACWAGVVLATLTSLVVLPFAAPAEAAGAAPVWQLPFENGLRWQAGSPHGASMSALDFGPVRGAANRRVVSVAAGKVYRIDCSGGGSYLGIDHGNGWASTYYHLVNVQSQLVGQLVQAGTYLGDAGQALPCGGSATFDHVHLTIRKDGQPAPVSGFRFGNYVAHSSGSAYNGYWTDASSGTTVVTNKGAAACCLTSTTTAGAGMAPRDGDMVRATGDSRIWWVLDGRRFAVADDATLECLGGAGSVKSVDAATRDRFAVQPEDATCAGKLLQVAGDPAVWQLSAGTRYAVRDEATLACLGGWSLVRAVAAGTRDAYPSQPAKASCDDQLIRVQGAPEVWWIHAGKRYPVPDAGVIACRGGWQQVRIVGAEVRDRFPARTSTTKCPTTITTVASAATVGRGSSATLTGTLVSAGQRLEGVEVRLEYADPSGAWVYARSATTSSVSPSSPGGVATFTVTPPSTRTYRLRFAGSATASPSVGAGVTIVVR